MESYTQELEKIAGNGETVTLGDDERYTDTAGNYGYRTWLSGEWRCYTDGAYCNCYSPDHCHCENCNCDKALDDGAKICDLCASQCGKE